MPIYTTSNVASQAAQRILNNSNFRYAQSNERLGTGNRINHAQDDASGLQISELYRTRIRGSQRAIDNAQDGINVLNVADGAYDTVINSLQRIRELTLQAASDTNGTDQRNAIKTELDQLSSEIDRIVNITKFNGRTLLNGSNSAYNIQVGVDGTGNHYIDVGSSFSNNSTTALNADTANLTVDTAINAQATLNKIDSAIGTLTTRRNLLGAFINRLESSSSLLNIAKDSQTEADGRIRNTDVAAESNRLISNQILQQAGSSLLTQANQNQQISLRLLNL